MSILSKIFNPKPQEAPPKIRQHHIQFIGSVPKSAPTVEDMAKIFNAYNFFNNQEGVDIHKATVKISTEFCDFIIKELTEDPEVGLQNLYKVVYQNTEKVVIHLEAQKVLNFIDQYMMQLSFMQARLDTALQAVQQEMGNFKDYAGLQKFLSN